MTTNNSVGKEWKSKYLKEPIDGWFFPPDFLREMTHAINDESNESIEMEELEVVLLHLIKLESQPLSPQSSEQEVESPKLEGWPEYYRKESSVGVEEIDWVKRYEELRRSMNMINAIQNLTAEVSEYSSLMNKEKDRENERLKGLIKGLFFKYYDDNLQEGLWEDYKNENKL